MEYLEQFWSNIAQEPRYITNAAFVFDGVAAIFFVLSSLQKGPTGSRFSGKRAADGNADLSGLLVGLTLQTTAGELYRALIEATGFGTRSWL